MANVKGGYRLIILMIASIGLYVHLTIGDEIAITLTYTWYAVLVLLNLLGALLFLYAVRALITYWKIQVAQAQMALEEVVKAKRDVRSFPKGEQVYHFGIDESEKNHALHLNPMPYSNGIYEASTQQQLEIYNQYHHQTLNQNNYYSQDKPDNPIPLLEDNSMWLDTIIDISPHIHICGPTTSGKTTLGKYIIEQANNKDNTDFYLINPKHIASHHQWPIDPTSKSIDTVLSVLQKLVFMLQNRIEDINYDQSRDKNVVVIVDEWDWIYEHYKRDAVSLLRRLIKVGAELNYKVLLVGQSPLSQDTGLSGSDYHNMTRIALWSAGEKLLNNLPMDAKDKSVLRSEILRFKTLPKNIRYGLIVPLNNQPEVKIIPHLAVNNHLLLTAPKVDEVEIDEKEAEIINILENGGSLRKAARCLTGKKQNQINSSDTNKVKFIARKHNISV